MKKILYGVVGLILIVVLIAVGAIIYLNTAYPKVSPAPDITIEATPERLARGEYLVKHVSLCLDCHSKKDYSYFSAPLIPGTEGMGGEQFPDVPGELYVPNITPAALGDWTDGEILRAVTSGVRNDNKPLAPIMPYPEYRYMTVEDARAVVAYLRTLPPIENEVPESSIGFPLNLIFRTVPSDPAPQPRPDKSDPVAVGKYLARIAGCLFCHTPVDQGTPIPGQEFSGGHEFVDPEMGTVRSANITPDKETGIGSWSKDDFIKRFKVYEDSTARHIPVKDGDFQTTMPWTLYAGLTESDLGALYEFLQTVKPIQNRVEKFTPPQ